MQDHFKFMVCLCLFLKSQVKIFTFYKPNIYQISSVYTQHTFGFLDYTKLIKSQFWFKLSL